VQQECGLVLEVLRGEQTCSGDLCQHAINLGEDWLKTCAKLEPSRSAEVQKLVGTYQNRSKQSGGECAFQGEQLIAKGCPAQQDCAVFAQGWATKCSEHASPLVVRMIEKQVTSSTQKTIQLDTTSCPEIFAKLTSAATCGNDFECEGQVAALKNYQARCVDPNQPQPLDDAIQQAILLTSAKQKPPAFLVNDARFAPEKGRLLLADGSGFVISVGDLRTPNVNLFIKALRASEYVSEIKLARVFSDAAHQNYLRIGAIDAADPETFFRRFPTLALAGQSEALNGYAANAAIQKLNEVVKQLDQQETALAGLLAAFGGAEPFQTDADFAAEVAKADKHLARVFERLAAAKRAKLPKPNVRGEAMSARVAFARRSWLKPFADVTPDGRVELGAVSPAVLIDVAALLPLSFAAYRENMDGSIGKARRPLEAKYEAELERQVRAQIGVCVGEYEQIAEHERALLACAFGMNTCPPSVIESTGKLLDEAVARREHARAELELAVASLEKPPQGKLEGQLTNCQLSYPYK